ncbi:MAG: hypothetical protein JXR59_11540 [Desulfuromonadaceae bacterium]|nr:hypothetical protein [Desulfuromonadaceae bacterium]
MLVRLVLLILLFFLFYTALNAVLRLFGGGSSAASKEPDRMVPCSQCGTYVPQSDALTKKIRGQRHYFCSRDCLRDFKKAGK